MKTILYTAAVARLSRHLYLYNIRMLGLDLPGTIMSMEQAPVCPPDLTATVHLDASNKG